MSRTGYQNFGIDKNSIKEYIIAAATKIQKLRNEIINDDKDLTLQIETKEDQEDAKSMAGPKARVIVGGMDKCGNGLSVVCGKFYAETMHKSLAQSHKKIPSSQKDKIINEQNLYTTNAGITDYDSKNDDNSDNDRPSRNPEPRAVSKAYILAKMHKKRLASASLWL